MYIHIDSIAFTRKPEKAAIGGIKNRLADPATIRDLSIEQIAKCLIKGHTVQPAITPLSDRNRAKGKTGTCDDDFQRQTLFMIDIDNKHTDVPKETPDHAASVLADHKLKAAFMYDTFNSAAEWQRFRIAIVADQEITDRADRDSIQGALIRLFPQSDADCMNADRVFFGTDKGLITDQTDLAAISAKADLLALADTLKAIPAQAVPLTGKPAKPRKKAIKTPDQFQTAKAEHDQIVQGTRNKTMYRYAVRVLKKCGSENGKAYEAFLKLSEKCVPALDENELSTIWNSAMKFFTETIAQDPEYIPPEEYDLAGLLQPDHFTDVDEAGILWQEYCDRLRFTEATGWIVYDGKVWKESESKAHGCLHDLTARQLDAIAKPLQAALEAYEAACSDHNAAKADGSKQTLLEADAAKAKAADLAAMLESEKRFYLKNRGSNTIKNVLTEARTMFEIDVDQLDSDPFLLNTPAGTIDLKTGAISPHSPYDFCTKITKAAPGNEGADLFREFLERITGEDQDLQRYLQQAAGMFAVGAVYRENLVIAYGSGGNGKSTLFNLLAKVLGDYSGGLSAETLTANCRKNKSPELAEMRGKRLIIAAELEEGMRLDTAVVKKLCSTDPIMAEKKFYAPFQFVPSHTVVLYTNHLPKVGTTDKGTWDRLIVVPFTANLRGSSGEILNYAEYLFDHAGGAVLSWIIEGARQFIANGYKIELPGCVRAAIDNYRDANNWLEQFIGECCEVSATHRQQAAKLYEAYRDYCDRVGDYKRGSADFKAALEMAGYEWHKTNKGAMYYGLRLTDPALTGFTPYAGSTPWDAA